MVGLSLLAVGLAIKQGEPRWLFLGLPFTLALAVMARYAPSGYRLAADGVHVERRARPAVIPYRTIRTVDRAPRQLAGISLLGSRGIFGRFGTFWNPRLGFYRLYLTNRTSIVWLATSTGWVGLSPDRPDEFVERLRQRLP